MVCSSRTEHFSDSRLVEQLECWPGSIKASLAPTELSHSAHALNGPKVITRPRTFGRIAYSRGRGDR